LFTKQLTSVFFPASSFYPGRGDTGNTLQSQPATLSLTKDNASNIQGDDSSVESEGDWLDESELEEAAPRRSSKFSESMLIEVRT
jgi:hypothetical protein